MAEAWGDLPIGAPARRALVGAGFARLEDLSGVSRTQVAALHGMGPRALGILESALAAAGLSFTA